MDWLYVIIATIAIVARMTLIIRQREPMCFEGYILSFTLSLILARFLILALI